jgi:hypothetical protein
MNPPNQKRVSLTPLSRSGSFRIGCRGKDISKPAKINRWDSVSQERGEKVEVKLS